MSKRIKLTQGKTALVDDDVYEELKKYKWFAKKCGDNKWYACRTLKSIMMHRVIMQTPEHLEVDHIDGNGLNNQKSNLRNCSHKENTRNKSKTVKNKSGLKGVCFVKGGAKPWMASISVDGTQKYLGVFKSKEDAYKAYYKACELYHGEFSNTK